jgi:hypothetical protein
MGRICWKITALVGCIVFSQTASAALSGRGAMVADNSFYQRVSQADDPKNDARLIEAVSRDVGSRLDDSGVQPDLDKPDLDTSRIGLLAQAGEPAAPATTPAADSKGQHDQSPPAIAPPPNPTSKAVVVKAGPSVVGCGLKYLSAELAGKLRGRKWKEFSQEECGPITTQAVFPSAIAPKYSGESPDKARTLTCVDQFNANKAANANDGLRWIEKSGGYYSECVSRLKG